MQDPENMSIKEIEVEYAGLRKKSSYSGKHQARASQLLKFLMEKRKPMEKLYEISEKSPSSMTIPEIIAEWQLLDAMLQVGNWLSSYSNRLAFRQQQLGNWLALGVINGDFVEKQY